MNAARRRHVGVILVAMLALGAGVARSGRWDFEETTVGQTPCGFRVEEGSWVVVEDVPGNRVLWQGSVNPDRTFNLALVENTSYRDLELSIRVKADTGAVDQGGGMVWRAQDKDNYYVVRYNPLEDNVRVYKVENGERTQLDHADAPGDHKWHTLRITMNDREILGYFDGKKVLVAEDSTFREAGMIGVWSKADARTDFDDLTILGK